MRIRLGRKAMEYKEKLEKGGEESEWAKKCQEKVKKKGESEDSKWKKQKRGFYKERQKCQWNGGKRQ